MGVNLHAFLMSGAVRGEWSAPDSCNFTSAQIIRGILLVGFIEEINSFSCRESKASLSLCSQP